MVCKNLRVALFLLNFSVDQLQQSVISLIGFCINLSVAAMNLMYLPSVKIS